MSDEAIKGAITGAQEEYEQRLGQAEVARLDRQILIRQALLAGVKPSEIARITGLSRTRISQLR